MITTCSTTAVLCSQHSFTPFRCAPQRHAILSSNPIGLSKKHALLQHPHPQHLFRTATADSSVLEDSQDASNTEKVSRILELIEDTDGGDAIAPTARKEVDSLVYKLGEAGQGTRPLENGLIFGNYNVAYVSRGSSQYGAPAGGRFRTGLGKLLFSTRRLCQSVLRPDLVINKVEFALFGFIPGAVGLKGNLISIPEKQGGEDNKDTVKVFFEPPVLSLPGFHIRIGPPSSVVLKTTYLDERVRLGLGSRGSLFVFTRGGESDKAGMELVGTEKTSPLGIVVITAFLAAMVIGGGYALYQPASPAPVKAAGLMGMLLGGALGGIFYRGGLFNDGVERPEVTEPTA